MRDTILFGDCRETLKEFDEQARTCITSPPYYGLRDYGGEDRQIGQEQTPDEFIEQYGRIEILKAMKEAGDPDFEEARNSLANIGGRGRSGSNPRGSAKAYGMGEMRDLMKK